MSSSPTMRRASARRQSYMPPPDAQPRKVTPLEEAVDKQWEEGAAFVDKVPTEDRDTLLFLPASMQGAFFCGHLMADLDSIAGAIGAAHLFTGVPARASDINSETKWALQEWKCETPQRIEDLLEEKPKNKVCLVDFQQQSQLNKAIPMSNIVGIIDHHALQSNTIVTEGPIFVDIRPWGCMSSILAHSYAVQEKYLPLNIAGMLLSAILSDTLNLRSPTTTQWDERMVSMLVQYLDIEDVNDLAARQFRAKSHELQLMSAYQLVSGDMKEFRFQDATDESITYTIGYGVIETTDAAASLARRSQLIPEIRQVRAEKELDAMLLAVVDIVNLSSTLFLAGPVEESLALAAYGGHIVDELNHRAKDGKIMELVGLVSRKKDFVPPLTRAVANGWKPSSLPKVDNAKQSRRTSSIVLTFGELGLESLERIFEDVDEEEEEEKKVDTIMEEEE